MFISIIMFFGRMYSVIDQLRCSDTNTDTDDSDDLDSGDEDGDHFDLSVNGAIQRWVPFFILFVYYSVVSAAIRGRPMRFQLKKSAIAILLNPLLLYLMSVL